tara:strand:+ start:3481 stop:5109 length:1629 start_codon:yes stop_codon:yes gene_type:complete
VTNNVRSNNTEKQGSNKLTIALLITVAMLFALEYVEKKQTAEIEKQQAVVQNALAPSKNELFSQKTPNLEDLKPVALQTENYTTEIDLVGGKITKLELNNFVEEKGEDKLVEIFHTKKEDDKSGMLFDAGWLTDRFTAPDANTVWTVAGETANSLMLQYKNSSLTFYRTFFFNEDSFVTNIEDKVINKSNETIKLAHYSQIHHIGEREDKFANSFTNYTGPEALVDNEKTQADYSDLKDGQEFELKGNNVWAGVTQQYFASAIIPSNEQVNTVKFKYNKIAEDNYYTTLVRSPVKELKPGENLIEQYQLYAGPKSTKVLEEQPVIEDVKLNTMLDYGWFHAIAKFFFDSIMWFNQYVNSLALSIIIVTIILKIVLFPLANKSYVSMAKMRKIQPEMKKLQDKYGNDRQAMGLEMMNLYKKHKVSPASGCWPMLIQIPIFFAMYKVILQSFEFRQADLALWIHDMSVRDPYFVLPILMGATMVLQQRMNPQPLDETQKMVMNVMPIAFTVLFLFFPSGLVLYWLTNNVLSIAQQYFIMKRYED